MIDDDRINAIFKEMDTYILELANDPSALGPRYFQDNIATCRNYLNRVSLVVTELNREKLLMSGELRKLESAYEMDFDRLLSTDEAVKRLANIDDRKATVNHVLREDRKKIETLRANLKALEAVMRVVTHRNRELHATMNAIKDQRRLMQTEIDTGSFYGDERTRSGGSPTGPVGVIDLGLNESEISAMLDDAVGPGETPPQVAPPAPEAPPPPQADAQPVKEAETPATQPITDEDEAIRLFLDDASTEEPSTSASQTENDDFSSLLDSV
jgi:hypothetical protein